MTTAIRRSIWERDGGICGICHRAVAFGKAMEIDHIVPRCKGGSDDASNLRAAHKDCNYRKRWAMDGYASVREAAEMLGISPFRVRGLVRAKVLGELPSVGTAAGNILIPIADLNDLLDQRRTGQRHAEPQGGE